jgi:heme exporter protein C
MNKSSFANLHLALTAAWLLAALYMIFVFAPQESSMGEVQRIFYIHMPTAVVALTAYSAAFVASIAYLMKRHRTADDIAYASAEVGFVFCSCVLVTGPLWAKPVWGIWWTWDARLTSTFVLWLLFISYLMLRRYLINPDQAEVLAAVVSIIGFADAIFDYMSIRWFRTQHPQPVIGGGPGSGLDPKMKLTLAVSLGAFFCLAVYLLRQRVALAQTARELSRLRRGLAAKEARD